ncbi:transporter substrate-binding domain-containing protein [Pontibacillus yanchengensis]|uniref:Transporter substrate-binding domain-containing protein n=2 Tax=Pontibacillus yanchengensis TaxID=462910 RepID=A0ACC7VKV1_9BACI|nr:amino acid ABC transporter substrate-binding protein [Pontibacillus yanchengensis]MYL34866.1 transporter substrate-binding domain-containing protein [Pontibacillus yanchengensis]MYL54760.1 transporter substrate-binding domain-containing protein [Pontibacillus yanchengensis]
MKKFLSIIAFTLLAMVIAACGTSNEDSTDQASNGDNQNNEEGTSEEGTNSDQNLYEQIKEEGVLRVGTEGTYPPYTFHDENDKLTGYDVEVAREVAKRLDLEVKFMETKWDSMFAGLNSKRFDMIANQVGIKPKREEKYDFSTPYTISTAVLVAKKGNDNISSFEDLEGATAAQSLTSNFADIAKEYGAEVTGVEGFNPAMQLLSSGRADATVNDRLSVLDFIKEKGNNAQVEIVDRQDEASESAMMFRKGNDKLVEAVNGALKEMKEDGTLAEISEEWFGEDVSTK